ncbi:MAG TPA: hypothetical protein VFN56_03385 [Candidatus Saccharimonadales bacterium]|nr:hypothetical protein [Candidatus Saccharimonadales bacterium]
MAPTLVLGAEADGGVVLTLLMGVVIVEPPLVVGPAPSPPLYDGVEEIRGTIPDRLLLPAGAEAEGVAILGALLCVLGVFFLSRLTRLAALRLFRLVMLCPPPSDNDLPDEPLLPEVLDLLPGIWLAMTVTKRTATMRGTATGGTTSLRSAVRCAASSTPP